MNTLSSHFFPAVHKAETNILACTDYTVLQFLPSRNTAPDFFCKTLCQFAHFTSIFLRLSLWLEFSFSGGQEDKRKSWDFTSEFLFWWWWDFELLLASDSVPVFLLCLVKLDSGRRLSFKVELSLIGHRGKTENLAKSLCLLRNKNPP